MNLDGNDVKHLPINEETDVFEDEPLSQECTPKACFSFKKVHHSTPADKITSKSIISNKSKINSLLYSVGKEIQCVTPISKNDVYKSIHALDDADRRNVKKLETKGRNLCNDFLSAVDVKDSFNDSFNQYDIEFSELDKNKISEDDNFIGPVNLDEKTRSVFFAEEPCEQPTTEIEENLVEDGTIFNEISADIEKHFAENSIVFTQEMASDTEENEEGQTVIALNNSLKSIEKIGRVLSQKGNLSMSFIDPEDTDCSQRNTLLSTQTFIKSAIDEDIMTNSEFKTASGTEVKVSQRSLMIVKNMFQDIDEDSVEIEDIKEENSLNNDKKASQNINEELSPSQSICTKLTQNSKQASLEISNNDTLMVSRNIFPNKDTICKASKNEADFFGEDLGLSNQEISMFETIGFSTAAGKPVTVSIASLEKAKNLFAEDLIEPSKTVDTAEKNPVKISAEAGKPLKNDLCIKLQKEPILEAGKPIDHFAESMTPGIIDMVSAVQTELGSDLKKSNWAVNHIQGSEESLTKAAVCYNDHFDSFKPLSPGSSGFSTAAGKPIRVSAASLEKAKNLFAEDLGENAINTSETETIINKNDPRIRPVLQKKPVLEAVKDDHFAESMSTEMIELATTVQTSKSISTSKPAAGNPMEVAKDSMTRAAGLFDDDFDSFKPLSPSFGFSTAAGKPVTASLASLEKAKNLFTQDLETSKTVDIVTAQRNPLKISPTTKFDQNIENVHEKNLTKASQPEMSTPMFTTAAGKPIKVSEESLARASKLFDDDFTQTKSENFIEARNYVNGTNKSVDKENESFKPMFSTASGSVVKISEESLTKVAKMFDDDFGDFISPNSDYSSVHCKESSTKADMCFNEGFTTAAGKPIQPSKESIERAAKLFDNLEENLKPPVSKLVSTGIPVRSTENLPKINTDDFPGFSTAAGKPIKVSEKSLATAAKLFDDDFDSTSKPVTKQFTDHLENTMFTTARGKPIHLSKESLDKAAKLFDNDSESNTTFFKKNNHGISNAGENNQHVLEEKSVHVFEQSLQNGKSNLSESEINEVNHKDHETLDISGIGAILSQGSSHDSEVEAMSDKTNEQLISNKTTRPSSLPNLNILKETNRTTPTTISKPCLSLKRLKSSNSQNTTPYNSWNKMTEKTNHDENYPLLEQNKNLSPLKNIEDSPLFNLNGKRIVKTEKRQSKARKLFSEEIDIFDDSLESQDVNQTESDRSNLTKRKSADLKLEPEISKKLRLSQNFEDEKIQLHLTARKKQVDIIKNKIIKDAQLGSWFISKENKNLDKLNHVFGETIKQYTINQLIEYGVQSNILDINSKNASEFKFQIDGYESNYEKYIDGFLLVPDINGKVGTKEIAESFLTGPDINPSLVNKKWVENHFRWIVWKLCAYERTFPEKCAGWCLNINNLLLQLKYRYDKEIIKGQKSSFRKIIEGDEIPGKTFICCIASIKKIDLDQSDDSLEVELTDGWYSVNAIVDTEMFNYVRTKKVKVGTKLIVSGAELLNFNTRCDILNIPSDVKFKIHTNSTRRVNKWYVKMGFYKENVLAIGLTSVLPNGGMISLTTGIIARVYPILYMSKDTDGKTVFRNEKTQRIEDEKCNQLKNEKAESIHEMIWKDVEKNHIPDLNPKDIKDIKNITDPEILYAIFKDSSDYSTFTTEQLKIATSYHEEITNKIRLDVENMVQKKLQEENPVRKVIKLLKVKIVDYFTGCPFLLTIWQPTDETIGYIQECKAIDLYNIYASGIRDKLIQLQTSKQTRFVYNECLQKVSKYRRKIYKLNEFTSDTFSPLFGEVEIVGIVIYVKKPTEPHGVTKVYLSDLESNYLAIIFWTCLSKFGCEDIIDEGALICCSNLQWRIGSRSMTIPCVYATETSSFSQNPKEEYFKQEINVYNSLKKNFQDFATDEKSKLLTMVNPYETFKQKSQIDAMDDSSTPCQKRLRLLNRFGGQMPPLSPIPLANKHPSVKKEFMSPFRTK